MEPHDPSGPSEPGAGASPGPRESVPRLTLRRRVAGRLARARRSITPGRRAWRGAAHGVLAVALTLFAVDCWDSFALPQPAWAALIPVAVVLAAAFAGGGLLALLVRGLAALPGVYLRSLFTALGLLAAVFLGALGKRGFGALFPALVASASLAGAGLGTLVRRGAPKASWAARGLGLLGAALGLASLAAGAAWLAWPGRPAEPVDSAARQAKDAAVAPLALEDPARPGPYRVLTLSYGSGTDRHRPEFGAQAALKTQPVDASRLVGRWSGPAGDARTRYWGFDDKHLPLQGRVWYPDGPGPFPLVLIVHGNHTAEDYSDPGYAYLGELLASRGFLFVSVDENFLNGSALDLLGFPKIGLEEENDARAFLLLEHLRQWRAWNQAPEGHPFRGRVDLERIALVGHSRGGEAVAVAAAFNPLRFYPDDARLRFDYHFGLRAVVALAPVDGQYKPAGTGARPENVDYLVLHGSRDGDVRSFHGQRVFERVRFTDGRSHFKAGVWVHGANHGQFNTRWGRNDHGGFTGAFLDRAAILPAADQRRVAQVLISAFLEASLKDRPGYRALFRDRRTGGAWLPEAVYLQQYADTETRLLAGFDEDIDVTTTTLAGGAISAEGLTDWKEREVPIKWGTLDTRAVFLGWNAKEAGAPAEPAAYTVRLPAEGLALTADDALVFHLADTGDEPKKRDPQKDAGGKTAGKKDAPAEPIDLTLELADRAGSVARVPLSRVAFLQPRVKAQVMKLAALDEVPASENVLGAFELPLRLFVAANPAFDPAQLASVRFVFDRTPAGVLILDDLGFRPAAR